MSSLKLTVFNYNFLCIFYSYSTSTSDGNTTDPKILSAIAGKTVVIMYCDVQMIVALSAVIVKLSETKPFLVLVECDSQISIFSVTLKLQLGLEAYCCKVRHGSPMFSLG